MLPSGALTTSLGSVNASGGFPALPGVPSCSSTLPSGLNLMTVCPLPAESGNCLSSASVADRASTTQTLPSLSTSMPCGQRICPAPKLLITFPLGSNLTIGSTFEPAHELAPHRSPTQIDLPSTSTWMALTDPHLRPSGSVPQ